MMKGAVHSICAFLCAAAIAIGNFAQTDYIEYRLCPNSTDSNTCHTSCPEKSGSWLQLCQLLFSLPGVFVLGTAGQASDAYGRKPVLLISATTLLLQSIVQLCTAQWNLSLWLLPGSSAITGITGNYVVFLMALFSSASDMALSKEDRTTIVARVEGGLFLGVAIGSFGFGQLSKFASGCNDKSSFLTVCVLLVTCIVLVLFVLTETLDSKHRKPWPGLRKANPLVSLSVLARTRSLSGLALIFGLQCCVWFGYSGVTQLYTTNSLNWNNEKYGNFNMQQYLASGFGMLVLVPAAQRALQWTIDATPLGQDAIVVKVSLIAATTLFALWAMLPARFQETFFWLGSVSLISGIQPPLYRSVISKQVPATELGLVFGAIATVEAIGQLVWPLIVMEVYKRLPNRSKVFLIASGVSLVTLIVTSAILSGRALKREQSSERKNRSDFNADGDSQHVRLLQPTVNDLTT